MWSSLLLGAVIARPLFQVNMSMFFVIFFFLSSEWEKAAKALKGVVNVAAVDATQDQSLASQYSVWRDFQGGGNYYIL